VCRENLDDVTPNAEGAAVKVDVVSLVLNVDEATEQTVAAKLFADFETDQHLLVPLRGADTVDTRDACNDDDVASREERARGAVAHPVDLIVYDRVLLDIGVARWDVRFGLVVVVVAHEILDRVVGKEVAHFAVELRRQGLVGRHDQGRPLGRGDDVGDGEGLSAAGDPEQDLVLVPTLKSS